MGEKQMDAHEYRQRSTPEQLKSERFFYEIQEYKA